MGVPFARVWYTLTVTIYILFLRLSYCLFACRIENSIHIFSKISRFAKVYTREICQPSHSRKLISAKLNFEDRRSRKFVPAKVCTFKVFWILYLNTIFYSIFRMTVGFLMLLYTMWEHNIVLHKSADLWITEQNLKRTNVGKWTSQNFAGLSRQ